MTFHIYCTKVSPLKVYWENMIQNRHIISSILLIKIFSKMYACASLTRLTYPLRSLHGARESEGEACHELSEIS